MKQEILSKGIKDVLGNMGNSFIKAAEFEDKGLVLKFSAPSEAVPSQYGADEDSFFVENGLLEKGQTFRFSFETAQGAKRTFDTTSVPFFIAIKQCEDLGVGDWVHVKREGKGDKTRYTVIKVDAPEVSSNKSEYPTEDFSGDVPF